MFLIALFSIIALNGFSQFEIKVFGGINASTLTNPVEGFSYSPNIGYQFGASVLIGKTWFVEPGIMWMKTDQEIKVDSSSQVDNNIISTVKIPVYVGYRFFGGSQNILNLRVFAGVTANIVTDIEYAGSSFIIRSFFPVLSSPYSVPPSYSIIFLCKKVNTLFANYQKKIPFNGKLSLMYNYSNIKDSKIVNDQFAPIYDESHQLTDGDITFLGQTDINLNSVIVKNENGSIIYELNFDYILIQQGEFIQIQRIPGGQIRNNDAVLVPKGYHPVVAGQRDGTHHGSAAFPTDLPGNRARVRRLQRPRRRTGPHAPQRARHPRDCDAARQAGRLPRKGRTSCRNSRFVSHALPVHDVCRGCGTPHARRLHAPAREPARHTRPF